METTRSQSLGSILANSRSINALDMRRLSSETEGLAELLDGKSNLQTDFPSGFSLKERRMPSVPSLNDLPAAGDIRRITSLDMLHAYMSSSPSTVPLAEEGGTGSSNGGGSEEVLQGHMESGGHVDQRNTTATVENGKAMAAMATSVPRQSPLFNGSVQIFMHPTVSVSLPGSMIPGAVVSPENGQLENKRKGVEGAPAVWKAPEHIHDEDVNVASANDTSRGEKSDGDERHYESLGRREQESTCKLGESRENIDTQTERYTARKRKGRVVGSASCRSRTKHAKIEGEKDSDMECIPTATADSRRDMDRKERRMRSNRESARRSRMRKQQHLHMIETTLEKITAERDELMRIVSQLNSENEMLRLQLQRTAASGSNVVPADLIAEPDK